MALDTAKAVSVREDGEPDGWEPQPGFVRDLGPDGQTQLVASVPVRFLAPLHVELVKVLQPPLGVMYRQIVDRRDPKPQGAPPRDFLALELSQDLVVDALHRFSDLVHHDARGELWIRGALGDHVVLDSDGLLHCAPDDPAFRDVLLGDGLVEDVPETIADRDYVMHVFHASNDALEDGLIATLGLTEFASRRV